MNRILKNKTEREEFLNNYKAWELWKEIPELELKFYRCVLPNDTVIIATEYACMKYARYEGHRHIYEKGIGVRYHLLLSGDDSFKAKYDNNAYKFYNPSGDSKSAIIQYLTETKPEV